MGTLNTELNEPAYRRHWWGVFALLFIVTIAYIDRVNVAVLIVDPEFLKEFGLVGDRVGQGSLMSLFLIGYGIAAILLTPFYESRLGYRRGLLISLFVWAVLTAAAPIAGSLFALLVLRVLLGVSEGPLFSLKTMFVKDRFAAGTWGKPNAVSSMGVSLGLAVGFPLVSYLLHAGGWALSFHTLAAINLLVGLPLVYWLIPAPRPVAATQGGSEKQSISALHAFRSALRMRHLGLVLLIEICTLGYLWGSSSWLPAYLVDDKGFSVRAMGWVSSLPFIIGIGANFLGGVLVDWFPAKRTPLIFTIGGIGCALSVLMLIDSRATAATLTFLLLASACWGIQGASIPTLVQRFSPAGSVGSAYGIINGIGNLVAAFMPAAMGGLMKSHVAGGFGLLVVTQVGVALVGVWLTVRLGGAVSGMAASGTAHG
ncbi:MAG: D-galactonate transporter [Burkholderiaceae bacterium]|nr:MAG: D-galactonate transporter [Burkholderiaceae bacterium]